MDYYDTDATCTCTTCLSMYDIWNIQEESADITLDTSYLHMVKDAKGIMTQ
jgi:hypothetical protein